jgi:hypothetical protein
MPKVAILTTDNLDAFFVYDRLLDDPLKSLGWESTEVSWRVKNHNWDQYDVVVVRSTWDYQAVLCNSMSLIEWNISKRYLKELEDKGVPIIPTLWADELHEPHFAAAFAKFNCDEIVIKPYVSANADGTYRLTPAAVSKQLPSIMQEYKQRSAMIQPFLTSILEQGEYSLFYFNSQYSHAICKQPAKGDFRVQEEHGGQLTSIQPSNAMFALAEQTIDALPEEALSRYCVVKR